MAKHKRKDGINADLVIHNESVLGEKWVVIYEAEAGFSGHHFEAAMTNLIREPNINSTVIMRADILKENNFDPDMGRSMFVSKLIEEFPQFSYSKEGGGEVLHRYLDDVDLRSAEISEQMVNLAVKKEVVRRIIPRNPFKDHIINQTCLLLSSHGAGAANKNKSLDDSVLVVYIPHIKSEEEIPFYLPPVYAVGILYHRLKISVHYIPFEESRDIRKMDVSERPIRIALRLLQTSHKHSTGSKTGYEKRVNHDQVISRVAFQNRYISLKKKYSSELVNLWCESTDPKKHVFEDLAIAAFLIELWCQQYENKEDVEFRDLGCGNGLLVYILIQEGYKGKGIDARARKSWAMYPENVRTCLKEQVFIPSILLKPHPAVAKLVPNIEDNGRCFPVVKGALNDKLSDGNLEASESAESPVLYYTSASLLNSSFVCTAEEFPANTFIIGNHSDELTCWIPLLGFPFLVIPCCSHALSGAKVRYASPRSINAAAPKGTSSYAALVDHVEFLALSMGWQVEKEMLRIPSTRNAALIATKKRPEFLNEGDDTMKTRILDILSLEGGADAWVENSIALMKKPPRSH